MNKLTLSIYNAIQAGRTIERSDGNGWWVYASDIPQIFIDIANEPDGVEIRIKPTTLSYRPYLHKDMFSPNGEEVSIGLCRSSQMMEEEHIEKDGRFIKWLDEPKTIVWEY